MPFLQSHFREEPHFKGYNCDLRFELFDKADPP